MSIIIPSINVSIMCGVDHFYKYAQMHIVTYFCSYTFAQHVIMSSSPNEANFSCTCTHQSSSAYLQDSSHIHT